MGKAGISVFSLPVGLDPSCIGKKMTERTTNGTFVARKATGSQSRCNTGQGSGYWLPKQIPLRKRMLKQWNSFRFKNQLIYCSRGSYWLLECWTFTPRQFWKHLEIPDEQSGFRLRILKVGLFYSHVQIGTPNITVLVALDTGSDLSWVPCNCKQCAGNSSEHNTYNSSASSTSSRVTCGNALCDLKQNCSSTSDQCPYYIQYASDNTSSSGVLVEDILYLTPENTSLKGKVVKAPITFGCGMVQTGALLEGTASYGLLGLGMESISVPSTLSKQNLVANSFSICFPRPQDGSAGRFVFGEKGSLDQKEAPFSILKSDLGYSLSYYVSIQEIYVGKTSFKANSTALFDSGTSFTYFTTSVYRSLASYYDSQVKDPPVETAEDIPFEYCYQSSNNQSQNTAQNVSLNIGGSNFKVIHPWVTLADESGNAVGYCLAVLESSSLSIIGQNFMRGYKLVFNREKGTYGTLGWEEANCLDLSDNDIGYASSGNNTTSAAGPSTYGTSWISNNTDENSSHNTSTEGSVSPQSAASKLSRSSFLSFSAVSFVCIVILEFAF